MIRSLAYRTLSGLMAILLSGIVFLLCCEMPSGNADNADLLTDSLSEHCKRAMAKKNPGVSVEISEGDTFDCCGFLPGIFDKDRKLSSVDRLETVHQGKVSVPTKIIVVFDFRTPVIPLPKAYIPDRQSTFLKNQVFRI